MANPTLKFMPAGTFEGFRTAGLSVFNNIDPDTLLRELIQNGQDAFFQQSEDAQKKKKAVRMLFQIEEIKTSSIPSYAEYKEHFESAVETQRRKGTLEQAEPIVDAMRETLDSTSTHVLWITDNGTGLDPDNMENLLGDGQSVKSDPKSTGSYGNGHLTVFPASDLRYTLYAGVFERARGERQRIIAGQAILASHQMNKGYGKDGFLVEKIGDDMHKNPFTFYSGGSSIPAIIKKKLDAIEDTPEYPTGSVIGILGFNRFNQCDNDKEVADEIARVAATHFAPAIHDGKMFIQIEAPGIDPFEVNRDTLREILAVDRDRQSRRPNSIGPSGKKAWEALETLGARWKEVQTSAGTIQIRLREFSAGGGGGGGTQLQLYRNGMWITNTIPKNRASDFRQSVPFSAVILLDPDNAKKACDLVRAAEGPRHIDLEPSRLGRRGQRSTKKRKEFDAFLKELHDEIVRSVKPQSTTEKDTGFFDIEEEGPGVKPGDKGAGGKPEQTQDPPPQDDTHEKGKSGKRGSKSGPIKRKGTPLRAKTAAVWENGKMQISIRPLEKAHNAELRLIHTSGSDVTCDQPLPDPFVNIGDGATIDKAPVGTIIKDQNQKPVAIELGALDPSNGEITVEVPCDYPAQGSIQVDLVKRAPPKAPAE